MRALVMTIRLYAPWVRSLKDKRSAVKSLTAKLKNSFNASVIEAGEQDVHQTIVLGVAALAPDPGRADALRQRILGFMEDNTEAQVVCVDYALF